MELSVFFWASIIALAVTIYFSYIDNRRKERVWNNNYLRSKKGAGELYYERRILIKDDK